MKKTMISIIITLLAIALITAVIFLANPLRRSKDIIRTKLLKITPLGTSLEDVIEVIDNNKKWRIRYIFEHGYLFMHGRPSRHTPENGGAVVGVKSMEVYLGEYRIIFATDVSAFYGFDEDLKLIDIAVLKETDAP